MADEFSSEENADEQASTSIGCFSRLIAGVSLGVLLAVCAVIAGLGLAAQPFGVLGWGLVTLGMGAIGFVAGATFLAGWAVHLPIPFLHD
ncbi:MAG: hypothetical protein AAFY08_04150 [Planctomycetota bacterium]